MSLEEKIQEKVVTAQEIANRLDDIEEEYWKKYSKTPIPKIPVEATKKVDNSQNEKWVKLDDVLALLTDHKQKLENLLSELRRAFVDEFLLADRYYEKNELQEIIKRILDENEKKFGELTK